MENYIQFETALPPESVNHLEEAMGDLIISLWWDEGGNTFGIIEKDNENPFLERFQGLFGQQDEDVPVVKFSPMDNRDWLEEDQQKLQPVELGRFFLCGPGFQGEKPEGLVSLEIDSPYAFGSGHHETTKTCLLALQELAERTNISRGLDLGCGSGVLSMAMATLWGASIYASDCDIKSVSSSQENFVKNGYTAISIVECSGINHPSLQDASPFDLIVANIHSEPLKTLAPEIYKALSNSGRVLLSGILDEQEPEVVKVYETLGMTLTDRYSEGGWMTLLFQKGSG